LVPEMPAVFVANAEVQRQLRKNLPVILKVAIVRIGADVSNIEIRELHLAWRTEEKVAQHRRGETACIGHASKERIGVGNNLLQILVLITDLEAMLPAQP